MQNIAQKNKNIVLIKIKQNLVRLLDTTNKKTKLLLAVSGGADSIAMLSAIVELKDELNLSISVITVNHNIRPAQESASDAFFVKDFCKMLNVPCVVAELEKNQVKNLANERRGGTEEAARFLRYAEFEKTFTAQKVNYILTAHTQDDFFETALMRVFQGADSASVTGIAEKRGHFLRPMLNINRIEIESYLNSKNLTWCNDATNEELLFLRNKIRQKLVPVLNEVFNGWQKGFLKTLDKLAKENEFMQKEYNRQKGELLFWSIEKNIDSIFANAELFFNLPSIFKIKFIEEGLLFIKDVGRIPYTIINELSGISTQKNCIYSGGFCIEINGENLELSKKKPVLDTPYDFYYMFWVEKECEFILPNPKADSITTNNAFDMLEDVSKPQKKLYIIKNEKGFFLTFSEYKNQSHNKEAELLGPFKTPFCIRSRLTGDTIKMQNGSSKQIKKILNEWNIDYINRNLVPIIEECGVVRGIYGAIFGKKNWYVAEVN